MRQSGETMSSVSVGHIILTSTQPVGSGRPQGGSNPESPHPESRALPTEQPPPPPHTHTLLAGDQLSSEDHEGVGGVTQSVERATPREPAPYWFKWLDRCLYNMTG